MPLARRAQNRRRSLSAPVVATNVRRIAPILTCAEKREPALSPRPQDLVQPFPGAIDAPGSEVMVEGLPGREVVWEQASHRATMFAPLFQTFSQAVPRGGQSAG